MSHISHSASHICQVHVHALPRYSNAGVRPAVHFCSATANCLLSAYGSGHRLHPTGPRQPALNPVPSHTHCRGLRCTSAEPSGGTPRLLLEAPASVPSSSLPSSPERGYRYGYVPVCLIGCKKTPLCIQHDQCISACRSVYSHNLRLLAPHQCKSYCQNAFPAKLRRKTAGVT